MTDLSSGLRGVRGEPVVLQDVSVTAVMQDLLCEVTVAQTYRNDEGINIEAVYTFPLPPDAVLLDLEVSIGDRVLQGVVVEKKKAEREYEEAISDGHAVAMLERLESGLYTINVGNLLPKEQATIKFRYALLYKWSGDRLRLLLPTTVAPRYGPSPHQPHQVPESSLTVENLFSLSLEIRGALQTAQFDCPSHSVKLERADQWTVLSLRNERAVMDRDFVLNIRAPQVPRSFAATGRDGDGIAVVASFQPFFPGLQKRRSLELAVVVDCSGSMQGDSMTQVKQALGAMLDSLRPDDYVTLVAFGNYTKALFMQPERCTRTNLERAQRFVDQLQADMGGTEIASALRSAYGSTRTRRANDIFLLTDGEVSKWETIVDEAEKAGCRIFTVGVSSAVSEAFVRELAIRTGGACELVSPREAMAERVVRHFERMRAPRARRVAVHWSDGASEAWPKSVGATFEGDTVVAVARFTVPPTKGSVELEVETDEGVVARQEVCFDRSESTGAAELSTVSRIAAALRMAEQDVTSATETALRYQLVSPHTNCIVVEERVDGEQAAAMPALRKVQQSVAAGWGGIGSVAHHAVVFGTASRSRSASASAKSVDFADMDAGLPETPGPERGKLFNIRRLEGEPQIQLPDSLQRLVDALNAEAAQVSEDGAFKLLQVAGFGPELQDLFEHAESIGLSAQAVATIVLGDLVSTRLGEFLVGEALVNVSRLQLYARQAKERMQELVRRAKPFEQMLRQTEALHLLQPERERALREEVQRLGSISAFLQHLAEVNSVLARR